MVNLSKRKLKNIEGLKLIEVDLTEKRPRKDIETLLNYSKSLRQATTEELFEDLMGERNLLTRLERYGQNSNFWKESKKFEYSSDKNAESERPSTAWLHSKVKCYESQAVK